MSESWGIRGGRIVRLEAAEGGEPGAVVARARIATDSHDGDLGISDSISARDVIDRSSRNAAWRELLAGHVAEIRRSRFPEGRTKEFDLPDFPPSRFITNQQEMRHLLRDRIQEYIRKSGTSPTFLNEEFGVSDHVLAKLRKDEDFDNDATAALEWACRLFNVRTPFIEFAGLPHHDGSALWADIEDRTDLLGIEPQEFSAVFGLSRDELHKKITHGDGHWPRDFCELLARTLHVRAWPEPTQRLAENVSDVGAEIKYLRALWCGNADLVAQAVGTGVTANTVKDVEGGRIKLYGWKTSETQEFARALGLRTKGPKDLPKVEEVFYVSDQRLPVMLRERITALDLPFTRLAGEVDIDAMAIKKVVAGQAHKKRNEFRHIMTVLCGYFAIPVYSYENPPTHFVILTEAEKSADNVRAQLLAKIRLAIREVQDKLSITDIELMRFSGYSWAVLKRFFAGSTREGDEVWLSRVMRSLGIVLDYQSLEDCQAAMQAAQGLPQAIRCNSLLERADGETHDEVERKWQSLASQRSAAIAGADLSRWGLSHRDRYDMQKGQLPSMHPGALRLAEGLRAFTLSKLQALLERDHPANAEAYFRERGLEKIDTDGYGKMFLLFPDTREKLQAIIQLRVKLLHSLRAGKSAASINAEDLTAARHWLSFTVGAPCEAPEKRGRSRPAPTENVAFGFPAVGAVREPLIPDEQVLQIFLERTGGDLQQICESDYAHLNYLLSLGDTYSIVHKRLEAELRRRSGVIVGQRRQIEILGPLVSQYGEWLKRTYGRTVHINDSGSLTRQTWQIADKFSPVVFDRGAMARDYTAWEGIYNVETEQRLREEARLKAAHAKAKSGSGRRSSTPPLTPISDDDMDLAGVTSGPLGRMQRGSPGGLQEWSGVESTCDDPTRSFSGNFQPTPSATQGDSLTDSVGSPIYAMMNSSAMMFMPHTLPGVH